MKLLVSALEPSANLHLENLLSEFPDSLNIELEGIFDERFGLPILPLRTCKSRVLRLSSQ